MLEGLVVMSNWEVAVLFPSDGASPVYEGCICVHLCMHVTLKMSVHVRSPGNFLRR